MVRPAWALIRRGSLLAQLLLVVAGAAAGYGLFLWLFGGTPQVAVLNGPQGAIDAESAAAVRTKLQAAAGDPRVKAVVMRVDSPGGSAAASEELFHSVLDLRQTKPVVALVDGVAASGAYFASVPANRIVATSSSIVGSVGAILALPSRRAPSERVVSTGPFKLTGGSERTYLRLLERVKENFFRAVWSQRQRYLLDRGDGGPFSTEAEARRELLQGKVYLGSEGRRLGLVDWLGSEQDAIRWAAQLAGLRRYGVFSLEQRLLEEGGEEAEAVRVGRESAAAGDVRLADLDLRFPYLYYLYLPP